MVSCEACFELENSAYWCLHVHVFTWCGEFHFSFATPVATFKNKLPTSALDLYIKPATGSWTFTLQWNLKEGKCGSLPSPNILFFDAPVRQECDPHNRIIGQCIAHVTSVFQQGITGTTDRHIVVAGTCSVHWVAFRYRQFTCIGRYAMSKVRRCLRHNLCSQPYGSKSLVRSTGSAVWHF
jgi:hypothetical protein